MQYMRCKCGKRESFNSGMPTPACVTCEKCGSTLWFNAEGHPKPIPHLYKAQLHNGQLIVTCDRCHGRGTLEQAGNLPEIFAQLTQLADLVETAMADQADKKAA